MLRVGKRYGAIVAFREGTQEALAVVAKDVFSFPGTGSVACAQALLTRERFRLQQIFYRCRGRTAVVVRHYIL